MDRARTYLDHNATSPLRPDARAACVDALAAGNPSSVHAEGRRARALVETARCRVAALLRVPVDAVVFTSGATEANNLALRPGALLDGRGRPVERLLFGATDHVSVIAGHGFAPGSAEPIPVDPAGRVDSDAVARLLAGSDRPTLVSVQAANNETGVIQPVAALARAAKAAGAALHVDAVQAVGRVMLDLDGVDAVSISSHKLGGPKGAGALALLPGRAGPAASLVRGGGQERGRRGGTENVMAIAGFGVAAEAAAHEVACEGARLASLRDEAERAVRALIPDAVMFGVQAIRLPNTLAFAVPGLRADTLLMALDLAGIAVSSGSACSSGTVGRSHVLAAMGVSPDLAAGAIRISFGWSSTDADVARFSAACETVLHRPYERRRARAA